ncbi:MAG TPA: hypothetical protein DF296_13505 [Candidatus Margulisbacteria bacterium]|nr:MAG: hypothetical protein A2X41_11780 [Candidatus Margulisbacteria bacterium GWE2_39_32]HCT86202.1 hypothetical protein [Candidatus Margulisiibacteriota bacterium]
MIKVNEYFEGNVKSLSLTTADGPATVGVMKSGEYDFGTSTKEIMTVISGTLRVKLPGHDWELFSSKDSFVIDANQRFQVKVEAEASYLCIYK